MDTGVAILWPYHTKYTVQGGQEITNHQIENESEKMAGTENDRNRGQKRAISRRWGVRKNIFLGQDEGSPGLLHVWPVGGFFRNLLYVEREGFCPRLRSTNIF